MAPKLRKPMPNADEKVNQPSARGTDGQLKVVY
jgi:hypothetical protein